MYLGWLSCTTPLWPDIPKVSATRNLGIKHLIIGGENEDWKVPEMQLPKVSTCNSAGCGWTRSCACLPSARPARGMGAMPAVLHRRVKWTRCRQICRLMTISSDNLRMDCLMMTTDRKRMLTHFFAAMLYCTLQAVQEAEASRASMCTSNSSYLQVSTRTHAASQVTPCVTHNMWHPTYHWSTHNLLASRSG
jgi:hypothetical protein